MRLILAALLAVATGANAETLTILHTNDFHSRIEPINAYDSACPPEDNAAGTCFGGSARLVTTIRAARAAAPHSLLVDGGDQFQGSLFYTRYKGQAAAEMMNALGYDAMTVGNHEFDDGPEVLRGFMDAVGFPVLMSNADVSAEPALAGADMLYPPVDRSGEMTQQWSKENGDGSFEQIQALRDNPDFTSVVNERHRERLLGYLEDAAAKGARIEELNAANEDFSQQDVTHKIPFTLVVNPTDDMKIMQEEIFGPLIAVKPYKDVDDCIAYINAHDRPLGLYIFSGDKAVQNHILDNTLSGGVTINDVMGHPSCEDLPFGGIGPSGLGHYRGYEGFKEFSHARAVYTQTKINLQRLGGMMPPYTKKCEDTLDGMIKK